jgi:hypothetical protein
MDEAIAARLRSMHEERYGNLPPEVVEYGRVRDFLAAMDEPVDPLRPDFPVPPLFLLSFGRSRRPQGGTGVGAVNAGDEYAFFAPLRIGDVITCTATLTGIEERQGKRGPMYLSIVEIGYRNQRGETVGVRRNKVLRWFES